MSRPDSQLLDEIVKRVTHAVQPARVILFGSAARGDMGPNADLDILVVMPDGTHRREASRAIFRAFAGWGCPRISWLPRSRTSADMATTPRWS